MKAHIGLDAAHGLVHTLTGKAANVSDVTETHNLLHGQEERVFTDAAAIGTDKRPEILEKVTSGALANIQWSIVEKRTNIKAIVHAELRDAAKKAAFAKSRIRARVEHPFHVIKNLFKHCTVRYRGLQKNLQQHGYENRTKNDEIFVLRWLTRLRSQEVSVGVHVLSGEQAGVDVVIVADFVISLSSCSFLRLSLRCSLAAGEFLRNKYPQVYS